MNLSKIIPIRYNLGNLSQYRTPLMGMSIIMILLCHARMDGAQVARCSFKYIIVRQLGC